MRKLAYLYLLFVIFIFVPNCFAGDVSYYIYDSSGRSVTSIANSSQDITNTYRYSDFGNVISATESKSNVYKYNGEQNESETGLIFLRNRYYDPSTGRFITKDPIPGIERNPQTLNPYVYVKNNPINRIDPTGEFEPITMTVLAAGAIAAADMWTYRWSEMYFNWKYGLNLREVDVYATKATWALATMFIPKPFSKTVERTSYFATEVSMSYAQYTFLSRPVKGLIGKMLTTGVKNLWNWGKSSFGGVSLSKTAQLMLDINDVAGATYDEATGQIILFGKEDISLPQMDVDDLAVAVNSVYSNRDPGVSIGTEPSEYPGWMKVRYDGATIDTEFGKVMFDADRLLKCLDMGYDNVTRQPVSSSVSGYQNMIQRELYGDFTTGTSSERKWFKPKDMKLTKNTTGDAMVFSEVTMELLTETTMQGGVVHNPEAEAFASHFTNHYDEFASEFPVLKELKRLGKITSVVKWVKDNNIPLDMSFFNDYQIEYVPCERYTPEVSVTGTRSWTEGSTTYTRTVTLTGGVSYEPPNEYLPDNPIDPVTEGLKDAAIAQRPSEETFSWNFQGPPGSGGQAATLDALVRYYIMMFVMVIVLERRRRVYNTKEALLNVAQ